MLNTEQHRDPVTGPDGPETDDIGPDLRTDAHGPQRRCIVTGEVCSKDQLIRFVLAPDSTVTPDLLNKLPGRGLYVKADRSVLERAVAKRVFAKAARQSVIVPDGLVPLLERLLTRRCTDTLSRARRAGEAVTGFEKCAGLLRSGRVELYLAATDAGQDGVDKLTRLASDSHALVAMTREEMGEAFGKEEAVHVVVAQGGLAQALLRDCERLKGVRVNFDVAEKGSAEMEGKQA